MKSIIDIFGAIEAEQNNKICLLLIDGLGWRNIVHDGFLKRNLPNALQLQTCQPATTAAAIPALMFGKPPEASNFLGYTLFDLNGSLKPIKVLNVKHPISFIKPQRTIFEVKNAQGYKSFSIGLKKFAKTFFNRAINSGSEFLGAKDFNHSLEFLNYSLNFQKVFSYIYIGDLDDAAHHFGLQSNEYKTLYEKIDSIIEDLVADHPDTKFFITADHGTIDKALEIDIRSNPAFSDAIIAMAGEPRLPYIKTKVDLTASDLASFPEIADNFEIQKSSTPITGDFILIPKSTASLADSTIHKDNAMQLISVHGGPTPTETTIPLFTF